MPNIEVHGFHETRDVPLELAIHKLFEGKPYADDVVVTIHSTTYVSDRHGTPQPFLRLVTTRYGKETVEIIKFLKTLGMDIEHIVAIGFYPKQVQNVSKLGT